MFRRRLLFQFPEMGSRNGHKGFFFLLMHGGWLQKIMKSTAI
jgi:hypothetical protein